MSSRYLESHLRNIFQKASLQDSFDINDSKHRREIQKLVNVSAYPQVSLCMYTNGKLIKRTFYSNGSIQPTTSEQAGAVSHEHSTPVPEPEAPSRESKCLFAIGSYSKIFVDIIYIRLFENGTMKKLGIAWTDSAIATFNELRRRNNKPGMKMPSRNPSIEQLLLHWDAFAPMDASFIAPDETFLGTKQQFIKIAPRMTDEYFQKNDNKHYLYSNANHIFAVMLLEELLRKPFFEIAQEYLFGPMGMTHTAADQKSLERLRSERAEILEGYRIRADMSSSPRPQGHNYLSDGVEVASMGAWSCVDDLAKLLQGLLDAYNGHKSSFTKAEADLFFSPAAGEDEPETSPAGIYCPLDSEFAGAQSLSRSLQSTSSYTLGTHKGKSKYVHYKGGTVDGFTSTVYISHLDNTFVIVLGNGAGPVDVTSHIASYILEKVFALYPEAAIYDHVEQERERNCNRIRAFEDMDNMETATWSNDMTRFAGRYVCHQDLQKIEIYEDGGAILRVQDKCSGRMVVGASESKIRLFPGDDGFGLDRWSVWEDLSFSEEERSGINVLVSGDGRVFYVE
ncbi:uncharacterized protein Z518_06128 [Rhinocladiella mackenziei CBS 650.93]|uniref:Beta-lactamase-related domain-containing protein n=1 Tax=Rhinocladiella mackenziei CBS 650.93 TaxID=1442369 RepID=A0A0D2IPZ3_9EURO|nr:uncharacterized protein Z518_06128 [Rhinocladiella mackenziei CBS 650.93]KIX05256.1 hypothetical protein Z518_06128 [Rhinocladiella mackenziei CBS 650.93]